VIRSADSYLAEKKLAPPDIIKIDVEGFEPEVIAGMRHIIATYRPIIVFEHIWLSEEVVRGVVPPDYELVFLLDDGALTKDFTIRSRGANAILAPKDKSGLLAPVTQVKSGSQLF